MKINSSFFLIVGALLIFGCESSYPAETKNTLESQPGIEGFDWAKDPLNVSFDIETLNSRMYPLSTSSGSRA